MKIASLFRGVGSGGHVKKLLFALCGLAFASPAFSGPNWVFGNITQITSSAGALLIMVDTGVPDNCVGSPYGWMLISDSFKSIVALTLLAKIYKSPVTVYTTGKDANGYCIVNQVQPSSVPG